MTTKSNKKQVIAGWVLSVLVILFMLLDGIMKFLKPAEVITTTVDELGYTEQHIFTLGILALTATLLYAIPRTSILGAILLTAYFGGAIASHLRINNPIFSHTFFTVYIGIFAWSGLWLRNMKLRQLLPFVSEKE
ncbi:MAG TPA: DoxX family protein [Flavobacterium sp.]|nr:DoxX family protein [Flavobacterium sp.]